MELTERQLDSERLYDGKIVKLYRDRVELPNGKEAIREVVRHPGGVIILPIDNEGNVWMVRQFRYPYNRAILEIPAGKLEYGEEPSSAARRELSEEIGATAGHWVELGKLLPTPGFCDEVQHLYLARDLKDVGQQLDPDEFLNVSRIPFDEMVRRCMNGEIQDAKTIIAVLKARELLGL